MRYSYLDCGARLYSGRCFVHSVAVRVAVENWSEGDVKTQPEDQLILHEGLAKTYRCPAVLTSVGA